MSNRDKLKKHSQLTAVEKSNEHKETEKTAVFEKNLNFRMLKKKYMPSNLFEFLEKFMLDTFLMKYPQFEKTGSMIKFVFCMEIC